LSKRARSAWHAAPLRSARAVIDVADSHAASGMRDRFVFHGSSPCAGSSGCDGAPTLKPAEAVKLSVLLVGLSDTRVIGNPEIDITEARDDSRSVQPGDLFVAVPGTAMDGRKFLSDAVGRGATALLIEEAGAPASRGAGRGVASADLDARIPDLADFRGTVVTVPNARQALAMIAANRFPSARNLTLTAVTGTNGKTTTTYLVEAMLRAAGIRAGVVGTIAYRLAGSANGNGRADLLRPAPLTTPGALALHSVLAEMQTAGATDVVLEASSIALDQARLDGCVFRVAGLTNVTQDHLDYHGTMDRYLEAKAILFERLLDPAAGVAVLPIDRPEGRTLRERARARGRSVLGVALASGTAGADVRVETATMSAAGLRARINTPRGPIEIESPLVGDYNLANIVLAVGMAIARGLSTDAIATGVARLSGVPGRLERVPNDGGVLCVVDYAHTPDALERAIAVMRPLVAPGGRLLTVFGCGGDRDRTKRPLMGEAAARGSDLAIVTSDNPRGEDPNSIIAMIVEGVRRAAVGEIDAADLSRSGGRRAYHVVPDRRLAIGRAVASARNGDVLLIAGKGHEDYQIVGANRFHFDDREEAASAFALMAAREPTT
jgi:UDP-N-acetylmuramoyl-L-alanyl-D-glutamate--2,6-diaminopimelate ligase